MALSPRERTIAIVVGAAIGLYVLDQFVIEPYVAKRTEVATQITSAKDELAKADKLKKEQKQLRKVWDELNQGGLKTDPAEADSQLSHALREWTHDAGLNYSSSKPERTTQEGKFTQINYHATATGSQSAVANFLWRIETTAVPVRVTDLTINSVKEGLPELQITLGISTLCASPDAAKDAKTGSRTVAMAASGRDR